MNYWNECVAEALCDAKIEATDEQIDTIASWVEGAHENCDMVTSDGVALRRRVRRDSVQVDDSGHVTYEN